MLTLEPQKYHLPVQNWGFHTSRGCGTLLFYEYTFLNDKLIARQEDLLRSVTAHSVGELYLEDEPGDSKRYIMAQVQRKRALTARFQRLGIPVWIDLTIRNDCYNLALYGVPKGWKSYSIRKPLAKDLIRVAALAQERAGGEIRLICYGGSFVVEDICKQRGWHFQPEYSPPPNFPPSPHNPLRPTPQALKTTAGTQEVITLMM